MSKKEKTLPDALIEDEQEAASRKRDHIDLAFQSQIKGTDLDQRFYYEPLLSAHPSSSTIPTTSFLGKQLRAPIWVSSMTGGTEWAKIINHNLARACKDFGMGMGLGSCRSLIYENKTFEDFNVRSIIGDDLPLYANLGIAQIEQLISRNEMYLITQLVDRLQADGLIIHVNPFQEWLQPEGDRFEQPAIESIMICLEQLEIPIIVKEVGQGMGHESLKALFQLPLQAIDFAASGGTNFAKLELLRSEPVKQAIYQELAYTGHSAIDMVNMSNQIIKELGDKCLCKEVIISGGVSSFLDGYYLINKLGISSVYGQASAFLKHARGDYKALYDYVDAQVKGLALANAFLKVRV